MRVRPTAVDWTRVPPPSRELDVRARSQRWAGCACPPTAVGSQGRDPPGGLAVWSALALVPPQTPPRQFHRADKRQAGGVGTEGLTRRTEHGVLLRPTDPTSISVRAPQLGVANLLLRACRALSCTCA